MSYVSLTLEENSTVTSSCFGDFSGTNSIELVLIRAQTLLQIYRISEDSIELLTQTPTFSLIRAISTIKIGNEGKDYILLGSDSGSVCLLSYDAHTNSLKTIHNEIFGKSGIRRVVPGQYIVADPSGRAVMVSAIEKQKFVYVMNRNSNGEVTISSPLEANKSNSICFDLAALDVGFDNPMFAAIEVDYNEQYLPHIKDRIVKKFIVLYEMDLGLNHVVRKSAEPINETANHIIPIPTLKEDVHLGMFICSENRISWYNPGHPIQSIEIPKMDEETTQSTLIVSHVVLRMKTGHFILVQSEYGDLFRIHFQTEDNGDITDLKLTYFDTIQSTLGMIISKKGHIFTASEFNDSHLYQITSLGDEESEEHEGTQQEVEMKEETNGMVQIPFFDAKKDQTPLKITRYDSVRHLDEISNFKSNAPITGMSVCYGDDKKTANKYILYTGRGPSSCVQVLKHQMKTLEVAEITLPAIAMGVYPLQRSKDVSEYLVVPFANATSILKISEDEVKETDETPVILSSYSVRIGMMPDGTFVQVLKEKIVVYTSKIKEVSVVGDIVCAAIVESFVVVGVSKGDDNVIMLFKYEDGGLHEIESKGSFGKIRSVTIENKEVPKFCAVACEDGGIRILTLFNTETTKALTRVSVISLESAINDVKFGVLNSKQIIVAGLDDGKLAWCFFDSNSGEIEETNFEFVGVQNVNLGRVYTTSESGEEWMVGYNGNGILLSTSNGQIKSTPLDQPNIYGVEGFKASFVDNPIALVSGNILKILVFENTTSSLSGVKVPLCMTPRKIVESETVEDTFVLCADNFSKYANDEIIRGDDGEWVSSIYRMDKEATKIELVTKFPQNVYALCGTLLTVSDSIYLVVGLAEKYTSRPIKFTNSSIAVYKVNVDNIQYLYTTQTEYPVRSMAVYGGRVLCGINRQLRMYEIGKKQLLRKAELRQLASEISDIHVINNKIQLVGISDGISFVRFNQTKQEFDIYADTLPRWTVKSVALTPTSYIGSDKFGQIFVEGLDKETEENASNIFSSILSGEKTIYNGAKYKAVSLNEFYLGDIATGFVNCCVRIGAPQIFIVSHLLGGISALIPLNGFGEIEFFEQLEMHMRVRHQNVNGRDHIAYRSSVVPVKGIFDGDLCELFEKLTEEEKKEIAGEMEREVGEIVKKLHDLRNMRAF
ncbi:splicing factor 3B subunit, putative [Entamoeba invadens IP1]|uniref:Splicing factor 3B subunit, putative n=1 Tax=Entamoeba invadens IP1 TaxID=370355 RepID=A0A0A1U5Y7_ENTIV|nr:splicing factor 3B subunit, putative [Entamoeba invadens IP1]ELP87246.1 splicing factor 3B subunit, putative [Entamoeba invadens IP1]|eukprot:XP_004254017.1 splicing factor 3B subunit, putative [Entamoeba invadens IP1]